MNDPFNAKMSSQCLNWSLSLSKNNKKRRKIFKYNLVDDGSFAFLFWAQDPSARMVVQMSYADDTSSQIEAKLLKRLYTRGDMLFVASAGNNQESMPGKVMYPAGEDNPARAYTPFLSLHRKSPAPLVCTKGACTKT